MNPSAKETVIYQTVEYEAPCPSGHDGAAWRDERIGGNQGRTFVECGRCPA